MSKPYILTLKAEADTLTAGAELASATDVGSIIFLNGELGTGKTTFVRGFLHHKGHRGKVKSPTYTIVEPYDLEKCTLYHFDLYRVKNADELTLLGLADYFSDQAICLIEWPEKGFPLLPQPDITCNISFKGDGRELTLQANSSQGERILHRLQMGRNS